MRQRQASASLSGSVFEVPCNTVVVADGRETEHSPILFPVQYSDQRDASGSLLSSEACVYDLSAHPPTSPVILIITTSIECNNRNWWVQKWCWTILNWSTATIRTPSNDFIGQKYHLLKHHFVLSIHHTFSEELNTREQCCRDSNYIVDYELMDRN